MLNKDNQQRLLRLARSVLENELLDTQHELSELSNSILEEKRGVFVTLQSGGKLRGCIGRIEAEDSIYQNVLELSKSAAFQDHRFKPLRSRELKDVTIEISILTVPEEVSGETSLLKLYKLRPFVDGAILAVGKARATFLPQVWDSIPNHEEFMDQLSKKARLEQNYWRHNAIQLQRYQVEHFQEEDNS